MVGYTKKGTLMSRALEGLGFEKGYSLNQLAMYRS